jgi:CRISPR type III-A-associated protein Csm2
MPEEVEPSTETVEAPKPDETPKAEAPKAEPPAKPPVNFEGLLKGGLGSKEASQPQPQPKPQGGPRPEKSRDEKPRGETRGGGDRGGEGRGASRPGGDRGPREGGRGPDRGPERGHDRREGGRPSFGGGPGRSFDGPVDIELEKLISDSLYLDNQAHVVVMRMRDMDSGTKSQLRRLYNAVRRAVRAPESERQHQFVMLRARLAYTIARHSLRSLDALERLLLQVTRKNDVRGYERFKDLFEAIVAYNE